MAEHRFESPTRRTILATATGTLGVAIGSGIANAATNSCADCTCDPGSRGGVGDKTDQESVCSCLYDFQPFDPAVINVTAGTQVTWKNAGSLLHDVNIVAGTGDEEPQRVGSAGPEASVCHTFDEPGTYYVRCEVALHEATMHQTVNVESGTY